MNADNVAKLYVPKWRLEFYILRSCSKISHSTIAPKRQYHKSIRNMPRTVINILRAHFFTNITGNGRGFDVVTWYFDIHYYTCYETLKHHCITGLGIFKVIKNSSHAVFILRTLRICSTLLVRCLLILNKGLYNNKTMQLIKVWKIRKDALNLIKLDFSVIGLWIFNVLDPCRHIYAKTIGIKMLLISLCSKEHWL